MSKERWSLPENLDAPVAEMVLPPSRKPRGETERLEWDEIVPGLALRVRGPSRSWVVVQKRAGKTTRTTLGSAAQLSRAQARALAAAATNDAAVETEPPLFSDFAETFLADSAARWKPATMESNARCVRTRLVPAFGSRRIDRIEAADVHDWLASLQVAEGTKARALAILSGLMAHAELMGARRTGSNPCKGLRRRRTGFALQELGPREYAAVGRALTALGERWPFETALLRFLALTGARRGEAVSLEWTMIDGARAALPDSKTGPKTVWLGAAARALLAELPRTSSPRVFPAPEGEAMDARLARVWTAVRRETGLARLRVHDLRHGFASVAATMGEPLRTISGLLGHSDLATTEGYAHLARAPVAAAARRVGQHLSEALGETPAAPEPKPKPERKPKTKPAPKSRRKRAVTAPEPPPDPIAREVVSFLRTAMSVAAYCRARALDEETFRNAVIAWRAANRERRR